MALKVVDEFEDTVDIEGVPAEAALLKGVKHSSIVELLAYRLTCQGNKKRLWILSEFCNAGTLLVRFAPHFFISLLLYGARRSLKGLTFCIVIGIKIKGLKTLCTRT